MSVNIQRVNDVLEEYYKLFYKTEDMALKRGIKALTHTELHIIESVGQDTQLTMNELADKIGITMGTATVAISKLSDKGYIDRARSTTDRRKVFVSLTKKGVDALTYHNNYHKMIMASITESIPEKDVVFYDKPEVYGHVILYPGDFIVVAPEDAHMPGCRVEDSIPVKKVVIKVKI